jgi:NADH:ubiquinone oxidoreductase subunit E
VITISVCVGSACHLKGAYNIIEIFQRIIDERELESQVELKAAFCLGTCTRFVAVKVDDTIYSVGKEDAEMFFEKIIAGRLCS